MAALQEDIVGMVAHLSLRMVVNRCWFISNGDHVAVTFADAYIEICKYINAQRYRNQDKMPRTTR